MKSIYHLLPSDFRKSVQRLLKGKLSYYQYYQINNESIKLIDHFDDKAFAIDGHPSFCMDGRYMVTDTYPDGKGYQHLIVYDIVTRKTVIVAKLYAGLNKKPGSCDLHPKLCKDNNYIAVDTAYDGSHHMILFKLNWDLITKKLNKNYE